MEKYIFKWQPDKNSIILPEDFPNQFNEDQAEISFILVDDNENKESVIYNLKKNTIQLKSLIEWMNDFNPKRNETISLERLGRYKYGISILDRENSQHEGFYLGKIKDDYNKNVSNRNYVLPSEEIITHFFICGTTGSGKTVLGKAIIEEAALKGIPSIIIDIKGDLSSLGIIYEEYNFDNLLDWINVTGPKKEEKCRGELERINNLIEEYRLTDKLIRYKDKLSVAVFSPKVGKAIPLSISSPLAAPKDIHNLLQNEKSEVLEMIGSYADSFIRSLFAEKRIGRLDKYKTFLEEIVRHCWENDVSLLGKKGLKVIQQLINEPPFEEIGGMPLNQFMHEKQRTELASRVAMCLTGVEQLWFEGVPLDIEKLLSRPPSKLNKTPVSIINVSELSFEEQMYVVSHVAYSIYNWARPKGDSGGDPRIIFFIDEIGGGGGKQAFFPSHPYNPPSKPPLNILLRKGRSFGISCLFSTQNPGDIDYKGLSNCGVWAVGQLRTERDRKKILEGISAADINVINLKDKLTGIMSNEFLIKTRDRKISFIRERITATYHETLSADSLKKINKPEVVNFFNNLKVND